MSRQVFQYDPHFGYRFIPNLKARIDHEGGGYLLRTNSSGFRCNHEFAPARTPGKFRILLFGDSYTAGDGVSNKDRYGDVLESLLPSTEVFNFGLPGSGTDQQFLIYRHEAANLEADLVVITVLVENIRRVNSRYRPYEDQNGETIYLAKPYFTLEDGGVLALHHSPVPKDPIPPDAVSAEERSNPYLGGSGLRSAINRFAPGVKELAQTLTRYQPLPQYDQPDHPSWQLMRAVLVHWLQEIPVPVIVMPLPLYHYVEEKSSPDGYLARFQELSRETGAQLHDPLPDLRRFPAPERRAFRFARDPHPTPAAHRVIAESLLKTVQPFFEEWRRG